MRLCIRLRPTWQDGLVIVLCLLIAAGCWLWLIRAATEQQDGLVAVVTVSGVEEERIELGSEREYMLSVNGYTLQICTGTRGVSVGASNCPGEDCVHMGWIDRANSSIVCLPARVVIRLEYNGEAKEAQESDIDVVIG